MNHWPGIRRIFRLDRGEVQRSIDDELRFHFAMKMEELERRGLTSTDARAEAERVFGNVAETRHQLIQIDQSQEHDVRQHEFTGNLMQDIRYAMRGLLHRPMFTTAVVLILGLGIGANATMFGIVDRLLFRPPAYLHDAASVNRVYTIRNVGGTASATSYMSYKRYLDLSQGTSSFSQSAAFAQQSLPTGIGESTIEVPIAMVSASFWQLFDAHPVLGRFFAASDDRIPAGNPVVVLGYTFWQRRFGGASDVVGKTLRIALHDYTVIGVAPRGLDGGAGALSSGFIPITAYAGLEMGSLGNNYFRTYTWNWMEMLVRRKAGVGIAAATSDLTVAYQRSYELQRAEQSHTESADVARPRALAGALLHQRGPNPSLESKVSLWLIGVSAIVLIIACANVGNLLLARALRRRREVAVRLALGITRRRLLLQMLVEALILSVLGAAAAVIVGQVGGGILRATLLPGMNDVSGLLSDSRTLFFTIILALLAGFLTGLLPAVRAGRIDIAAALKAGTREGTYQRSPLRTGLLILQSALSIVLLVGAGLFMRSFQNVRHMPLGYDGNRLVWATIELRGMQLGDSGTTQLLDRLLATARSLPGVDHATRNLSVPFWNSQTWSLTVPGIDSVDRLGPFQLQAVASDYFATTGTLILRGRPITDADRAGAPGAMVVSASMAKRLWPSGDAIGKCVKVASDTAPCSTVVGIAQDITASQLRSDPGLMYYVALAQHNPSQGGLFIHTRQPAAKQAEMIRLALQRQMPGSSYIAIVPFTEILQGEMRSWELGATMFTVFGVLAFIVAIVGLYSVTAYTVAQRNHEMGVRVALGARAAHIVKLVVKEAMRIAAVAAVLGLVGVALAGRWVAPLLFNTSAHDPSIILGVLLVLLVVSVVASTIPALRAARVDPNVALRAE